MTLQQQSNKNHFRKHFYDFFEYLLSWYVYLMDIGIHIFQENLISLKINQTITIKQSYKEFYTLRESS